MSGYLIPSDIERMARVWKWKHQDLGVLAFAKQFLSASPGPLVAKGGIVFRIPTLVPSRLPDGCCIFFKPETGRCLIWPHNPYGCSHFSMHMSMEEANTRSARALMEILQAHIRSDPYSILWDILDAKGYRVPPPEEVRTKFDHGIVPSPTPHDGG